MRIVSEKNNYKLTPQSVDAVSEEIEGFLVGLKAKKRNILETRISVEEILLALMEIYGSEKEFTFTKSGLWGKPCISLSYEGTSFNPLEKNDDDEFGNWSSSLIQNADYTPSYSYNRGINTVTIRFPQKEINPIFKLFLAIAAAVLVSLLRFVLPQEGIDFAVESLLGPLYNAFLGVMATVEIPLVFFSITCGIIGIGDSSVFGKIGRKMVLRFSAVVLGFTCVGGIVFSGLFVRLSNTLQVKIVLKSGIDLLLDAVPKGLLDPFLSGNTMQIVLIAIVVGVAFVMLGSRVRGLTNLMNECNSVIVYITEWISRLLPFFIFIVLVNFIWSESISSLLSLWKPLTAFVLVSFALLIVSVLYVAYKEKVNVFLLVKKMLPTFLISFGTASSTAANAESSQCLAEKMGVTKRFVSFGQPVGSTVFMPTTSLSFMACAVYMAQRYEVEVSLLWIIIAIMLCTFVSIATPPVPGGAIAAYTVIFTQLGIPTVAVATIVAVDIIFDLFATAFDGAFMQLEVVMQAEKNKMIDYDILRN